MTTIKNIIVSLIYSHCSLPSPCPLVPLKRRQTSRRRSHRLALCGPSPLRNCGHATAAPPRCLCTTPRPPHLSKGPVSASSKRWTAGSEARRRSVRSSVGGLHPEEKAEIMSATSGKWANHQITVSQALINLYVAGKLICFSRKPTIMWTFLSTPKNNFLAGRIFKVSSDFRNPPATVASRWRYKSTLMWFSNLRTRAKGKLGLRCPQRPNKSTAVWRTCPKPRTGSALRRNTHSTNRETVAETSQ